MSGLIEEYGSKVKRGELTWKKAAEIYENITGEKITANALRMRHCRLEGEEKTEKSNLIDAEKFAKVVFDIARSAADKIKAPPKEELFKGKVEESAVLMISDVHVGKVNHFLDLETGDSRETYNRKIMLDEFNGLLDGVCSINALLSETYNIRKLYMFLLGDIVDNNMIFRGQKWFVDVGVGVQVILAANCFKKLILELLSHFEEIEVIVVGGNHGRMTQRREAAPFYNNFDWLMGQVLQRDFSEEDRVSVITPESWFYLCKIYGWKYMLHHGDTVFSWMGIPYYGITRQAKARRTEVEIDMGCIGHFHQRMEIPVSSKSNVLVNGCWIEADDFAWKKYGVISKPEQTYFGVSPKRPATWLFRIDLKREKTPGEQTKVVEQIMQPNGGEEGF